MNWKKSINSEREEMNEEQHELDLKKIMSDEEYEKSKG